MGKRPLDVTTFTLEVASLLEKARIESGQSYKALAPKCEVGHTRLREVLTGEKSMTVAELERIAHEFGLRAWEVARQAEEAVAAREREAVSQDNDTVATSSHGDTVPDRAGDGREAERDRIAALIAAGVDPYELGLAASRGRGTARALEETTGWRDDLGEESQVGPEEE